MPKKPPLLSTSVESPFDDADFEVHVTAKTLTRWAEYPALQLAFEHAEDEMGDADPTALRWVSLDLGSVRALRLLAGGRTDELGAADLRVVLEDGDGASRLVVDSSADGDSWIEWPADVVDAIQRVLHAVLDGQRPPTEFPRLASPPTLTAAAILADGWADGACSVDEPAMEDWWTLGMVLDVDGLVQAIDRGEGDDGERAWGVHVDASGARTLVRPLFEERHHVTFAHDGCTRTAVRRYWLSMHVAADGRLDDVSVRYDADGTFAMELPDRRSDDLRRARLRESSYGPVLWVLERFRVADA